MGRRGGLALPALALLGALLLPLRAMAQESEQAMMQVGLDLLYAENDPGAAAAQFRRVLEQNPSHYGATFQLARALDRAGEVAEARPLWDKVLEMAEGYNDRPGPAGPMNRPPRRSSTALIRSSVAASGAVISRPIGRPSAA